MQPAVNPSFYDIEPLRHWLERGVPILTPNFRLARRIKLGWGQWMQQQEQGAWPTPTVMSLEHWWSYCLEQENLAPRCDGFPQIATAQQELAVWERVISANPRSSALLRPRAAAQMARQAWHNLLLWRVDCEEEQIASLFRETADSALFLQWLRAFNDELQLAELTILPRVAPQLAARQPVAELALVEFDELAPLYEQLLEQQADKLHRFSHKGDESQGRVQACDNPAAELSQAAHWARSRRGQGTVAILVPDLSQRRQSVERVFRESHGLEAGESLPINISAGMPLDNTGPVRTALGLLGLLCDDPTVDTLVGLLHSRYRPTLEREAEVELIRLIYRKGREQVSREDLRYWCSQVDADPDAAGEGLALGRQLLELSHDRELRRRHGAADWIVHFANCLQTLGWPGAGPLNSLEYQQVEHWHQALESLAELDRVSGKLAFSGALQLLRQLCADTVFQPQTADAPVQVLGLLEAAGLQFDQLWICGLNNASWPPPAAPNPFIPVGLQRNLGMPHADADREYRYAARQLKRFSQSCKELVVSYALLDEDIPGQPSPLLREYEPVVAGTELPAIAPRWLAQQEQLSLEQVDDRHALPVGPAERDRIRGGSGLLADQSQCPFRAMTHHRLNARALPELGVALDAADRGTLLHDSLYQLWSAIESQEQLLAMNAEGKLALVEKSSRQAVHEFSRRNPGAAGRGFMEIEQQRLQRLLLQWLELEETRKPFQVIAREAETGLELGDLQINLRIDRIDRLEDGGSLVIDYKSASASSSAWLGERPEQPQLPLYATALGTQTTGLAFATVRNGDCRYDGLARNGQGKGIYDDIEKKTAKSDSPVTSWEGLLEQWEGRLRQLAGDFMAGQAAVDPLKNNSCDYCGLQALCRVGSRVDD